MPTPDSLPPPLAPFDALRVWRRRGERAPHKPLLVLYTLGRWARGERGAAPFEDVEPALGELLREFGPDRQSYHPEYPFWRLQTDGVWTVQADEPLRMRVGSNAPPKSELLEHHARGGFTPEVARALEQRPALVGEIARRLLEAHFPASLHDDLLAAVGLELRDGAGVVGRPRDPGFRARVLNAYEERCAVCDLDLRLGAASVALEAAHIRWHQAGGPDVEPNGLALCSLHHKVFDRGAFTLEPDHTLLVSDQVRGGVRLAEVLLRHHGRPIRAPQHPELAPAAEHVAWHREQVFKGRPRAAV